MKPLKDEIIKMRKDMVRSDHELSCHFLCIPTFHIVDFLGGDSPTNGGLYMQVYMSKIFKRGMGSLRKSFDNIPTFRDVQNPNIKKEYSRVYYA